MIIKSIMPKSSAGAKTHLSRSEIGWVSKWYLGWVLSYSEHLCWNP